MSKHLFEFDLADEAGTAALGRPWPPRYPPKRSSDSTGR